MQYSIRKSILFAALVVLAGTTSPRAQVVVGVGAPLTGPSATYGDDFRIGAELAVGNINRAGGLFGQQISLSYGDDVADPRQGVSVANKFAADGIKLVVGHFNSGVTIPASEIYAENQMLMITPASTNSVVTERGYWNVFRTCGRDDQQGDVAGQYIADNYKDGIVVVIHDKTPYGEGLALATKKKMNSLGVSEAFYEGLNPGEKDFAALVGKIKAARADLVYFGGLHTEGGLLVRQMRDQNVNAVLMSGDGIATSDFATIAGEGAVGSLMSFAPDPRKSPASADVMKQYADSNVSPGVFALYVYAAFQVLEQAANGAKTVEAEKMAEFMHSGASFDTVVGNIAFDRKGDLIKPDYTMYVWERGADGTLGYQQCESGNCKPK